MTESCIVSRDYKFIASMTEAKSFLVSLRNLDLCKLVTNVRQAHINLNKTCETILPSDEQEAYVNPYDNKCNNIVKNEEYHLITNDTLDEEMHGLLKDAQQEYMSAIKEVKELQKLISAGCIE